MTQVSHKKPSPLYMAFIGDVVGSRDVPNRAQLQRRLVQLLDTLNSRHGEQLIAPLRLVGGDEFQGLFRSTAPLVHVITTLEEDLHPVRLAHGVGWGGLSTDPGPDVGALDGPVFHRAREALDQARADGAWVRVAGFGPDTDALVSATFGLMDAVRGRWTGTQRRYARASRDGLQREVAARFSVSESTVSKSLSAARVAAVRDAERALAGFLGDPGRGGETPS